MAGKIGEAYSFACRRCREEITVIRAGVRPPTFCAECYRLDNLERSQRRNRLLSEALRNAPKHCPDCGIEIVGASHRGRKPRCQDCRSKREADRQAQRSAEVAEARSKQPRTYSFVCERCGASEARPVGTKRRRFCVACRSVSGRRLTSNPFCSECGCRMKTGRTRRCPPCAAVYERVRLATRHRRVVRRVEKRIADALRRGKGWGFLQEALGYSVADLRAHLERQFTRRMTWDRFAAGEIHIDHIVPLRAFDLTRESEVAAAFAITNLRPMWAKENMTKGGKITTMI